ncbi:hypothetical protein OGCDGJMD_01244 [Cyanobium usitatum str. Tous]|uniref:hypothetical protein n=1 Tax=Cyanobium usitatum TaxID=2304190 RepID=UPI002AD569C7|nr:hypothetical protein [Cyanobium usitatum]CAK6692496.1 hypothetical protein OGCDGJMD_01244 [Cyanobium usitatum str. Tous]
MTSEQQSIIERGSPEGDERFLPASSPWLARYFDDALVLIGELQMAADLSDFVPACIDDQALAVLIERFRKAGCALPDEYDGKGPHPLELAVLERALYLLQDFLELEQSRRKYDPAYADECKGANETKRYFDAHNRQWPPSVLGGNDG